MIILIDHSADDYLWTILLTAEGKVDRIYAATLNWVTQASFNLTVVAVSTKADSHTNGTTKIAGKLVLNVLGKGQLCAAYAFLKPRLY